MALVEVIKWEVSTSELVHKFQVNDLKLGSQLVVYRVRQLSLSKVVRYWMSLSVGLTPLNLKTFRSLAN